MFANALVIWLLFGLVGVVWAQRCNMRDKRIQNEWKVKQGWIVTDDSLEWDLIFCMMIATLLGPIWFGIVYWCEHDREKE